jgi:hypothetical protein
MASKAEQVQQLLPWWAKLAHRALLVRNATQIEVDDEDEANALAARTPSVRLRSAVDRDAGP